MRWAFLLCVLLLGWSVAAEAQRRPIRVDGFGTWDLYDDPTPNCPGWSNGSTLLLGPGLVFSGRDDPIHLTDTYCQIPVPDSLTEASFFYPDETSLASMIGDNPGNRVTAKRYSMLDRPRFDFDDPPTGFQWTYYYFPGNGTIVGLYGLEGTTLTSSSYITYNNVRVWDAGRDGFDGQYFCFDGIEYVGTWNGALPSASACVNIGFRLFRSRFE